MNGSVVASVARSAVCVALLATGCASSPGVLSEERLFPGTLGELFTLAPFAIHNLGGEIVAQSREGGVITAHWEADTAIMDIYLSATVVHRFGDGITLAVSAWSEISDPAEEDLAYWRRRFLDELEALWAERRQRSRRRR